MPDKKNEEIPKGCFMIFRQYFNFETRHMIGRPITAHETLRGDLLSNRVCNLVSVQSFATENVVLDTPVNLYKPRVNYFCRT